MRQRRPAKVTTASQCGGGTQSCRHVEMEHQAALDCATYTHQVGYGPERSGIMPTPPWSYSSKIKVDGR